MKPYRPEYGRSSCIRTPPTLVGAGSPRAKRPDVAVSVPSGLTFQPRLISMSSKNGPQLSLLSPVTEYGQAPTVRKYNRALRLCDVAGAIFSSGG